MYLAKLKHFNVCFLVMRMAAALLHLPDGNGHPKEPNYEDE
jgi:hypothetical protein